MPHIGLWDILLLVVVALMSTAVAYLHHPKWKALVLSMPIPFSMAAMALGAPVDATNVVGLLVLLVYTHAVRVLYIHLRVPIVVSIALAAAMYCGVALMLAGVIPTSEAWFWGSAAAAMAVAAALTWMLPARHEPGHRTPLPVWIKVPIIVAVVAGLILIKKLLGGFVTMFPMVSLVAAYEARKSLWTICRQIPILMLASAPMMAAMRLTQGTLGLGGALAVGWVVFLGILLPLNRLVGAGATLKAEPMEPVIER